MCSYCGCYENPLIKRFMDEHVVLINEMGAMRRGIEHEDADAVVRACDAIARLFAAHSEDEEAGIFHEMKQDETYAAQIEDLCGEHGRLDHHVAAIRGGAWDRYPAFEQMLRVHIDKEDNGLFPAANIELFGHAWERIQERTAAAMAARGEDAPPTAMHHGCDHGHDHPHPHEHDHTHDHAHPRGEEHHHDHS